MRLLRAFQLFLRRRFPASVCAVAILVLVAVAVNAAANYGMVYPTPETQSTFLKNYLPTNVIARFDEQHRSSRGEEKGSSAGCGFASHNRTLHFYFVTRPENAGLVAKALHDDAVLVLQGGGMRVFDQSETAAGALDFHYADGRTEGTVTIEPVVADDSVHRRMPLPPAFQDVKAVIRIDERWVKK